MLPSYFNSGKADFVLPCFLHGHEETLSPEGRQRLAMLMLGAIGLATSACPRASSLGRGSAKAVSPSTPGHAALVSLLQSRRLIQPRLTGGFRYAPVGDRLSARERKALVGTEDLIRKERSLHVSGLLYLILGRSELAVATLSSAAAHDPRNLAILSDLSA